MLPELKPPSAGAEKTTEHVPRKNHRGRAPNSHRPCTKKPSARLDQKNPARACTKKPGDAERVARLFQALRPRGVPVVLDHARAGL
jgi:predicted methyltransferase